MIELIFVLIGVGAMFAKSFSVTSKSELRRPRTIYFGLIVVISAVAAHFVLNSSKSTTGDYSSTSVLGYALALVFPILAIVFLKQPKLVSDTGVSNKPSGADKTVNFITWAIFGIIGIAVLYFAYTMLVAK